MTELLLRITDGVVRTEVRLEFQNELGVAVHPEWMESGGFGEEEVGLEPF